MKTICMKAAVPKTMISHCTTSVKTTAFNPPMMQYTTVTVPLMAIPTSQGTLNTASISTAPPNRQIPTLNTAHITWKTDISTDILPLPG